MWQTYNSQSRNYYPLSSTKQQHGGTRLSGIHPLIPSVGEWQVHTLSPYTLSPLCTLPPPIQAYSRGHISERALHRATPLATDMCQCGVVPPPPPPSLRHHHPQCTMSTDTVRLRGVSWHRGGVTRTSIKESKMDFIYTFKQFLWHIKGGMLAQNLIDKIMFFQIYSMPIYV